MHSTTYYASAYNLDLLSSLVYPGTNYGPKYYGYTVRCVTGS